MPKLKHVWFGFSFFFTKKEPLGDLQTFTTANFDHVVLQPRLTTRITQNAIAMFIGEIETRWFAPEMRNDLNSRSAQAFAKAQNRNVGPTHSLSCCAAIWTGDYWHAPAPQNCIIKLRSCSNPPTLGINKSRFCVSASLGTQLDSFWIAPGQCSACALTALQIRNRSRFLGCTSGNALQRIWKRFEECYERLLRRALRALWGSIWEWLRGSFFWLN